MFLGNASTARIRAAMRAGALGQLVTPGEGRLPIPGVPYGADNGCYSGAYPGDQAWISWVRRLPTDNALFVACPDVLHHHPDGTIVGDAAATLERSGPWLAEVRAAGKPAALVAQDGLEDLDVPWAELDALFLGGSVDWKLGPAAMELALEAVSRGKWLHVGKVNSRRRFLRFELAGAGSADGTTLAIAPDKNLAEVIGWQSTLI